MVAVQEHVHLLDTFPPWKRGIAYECLLEMFEKPIPPEADIAKRLRRLVAWRIKDERRAGTIDHEWKSTDLYQQRRRRNGDSATGPTLRFMDPISCPGRDRRDMASIFVRQEWSDDDRIALLEWSIDGSGHEFLKTLTDTERIVVARLMQGALCREIGEEMGCGECNVSRIRNVVKGKYREWVRSLAHRRKPIIRVLRQCEPLSPAPRPKAPPVQQSRARTSWLTPDPLYGARADGAGA